jgi:hypothetical protein
MSDSDRFRGDGRQNRYGPILEAVMVQGLATWCSLDRARHLLPVAENDAVARLPVPDQCTLNPPLITLNAPPTPVSV